jgi:hypothetical protein
MAKSVAKKSAAPVAKKTTKVAKSTKTVAKKAVATTRAPNPLHDALVKLMLRPTGATIQDFQGVEGFNIPSMAVVRIAERNGYKASASKKPGERTVYKAVKAS